MARELRAAKVGLVQLETLDHHAPRSIEDEDALARGREERRYAVGARHAAASRTPSTRQIA